MAESRKLMAVFAHPDDETFGMGGTLALYTMRGVEISLVCATRGEAGEVEDKYLASFSSVAELRLAELGCAAKLLGIKQIIFLDYRDSGMPGAKDNSHPQALINAPLDVLVGDVVRCIRQIQPQIIVTHDPIGGYGHPDHIHLHHATGKAFSVAGDENVYPQSLPAFSPQKLYYNTISRTILRWIVRFMPLVGKDPRKFGQNRDIDLRAIAAADFPVHARIDYSSVADIRSAASICYASQGGQQANKGVAGLLRGWARAHEIFMLAYPQSQPGHVEKDLFAGITLES